MTNFALRLAKPIPQWLEPLPSLAGFVFAAGTVLSLRNSSKNQESRPWTYYWSKMVTSSSGVAFMCAGFPASF